MHADTRTQGRMVYSFDEFMGLFLLLSYTSNQIEQQARPNVPIFSSLSTLTINIRICGLFVAIERLKEKKNKKTNSSPISLVESMELRPQVRFRKFPRDEQTNASKEICIFTLFIYFPFVLLFSRFFFYFFFLVFVFLASFTK